MEEYSGDADQSSARWGNIPASLVRTKWMSDPLARAAFASKFRASGQSKQLNRNIPHPSTNRSSSIGTYRTHRPIKVAQ
eukprot:575202-Prorocentrum_minimum.AAC.1